MVKKLFALASVTALSGLVMAVGAAGCSSTTTEETVDSGGGTGGDGGPSTTDGGKTKKDSGSQEEDDASVEPGGPEEQTVGKLCASDTDCNVPDTKNDNICSKGAFTAGDLWGSPVCVQTACTQGTAGTVDDILCDDQAGLCLPQSQGSTSGICLPFCSADSTSVKDACQGDNKCAVAYLATDNTGKAVGLGYCEAACTSDADCKGTAGQKCQVESGACLTAPVTYAKKAGEGCDPNAKTAECSACRGSTGGTTGFCTNSCTTGAAGDAACGAAVVGWKCTAELPLKASDGTTTMFTGQPDNIRGLCALPCTTDLECTALGAATSTTLKCKADAAGSFCGPA